MTAARRPTRRSILSGLPGFSILLSAIALNAASGAAAADEVHRERVAFAKGSSATTLSGTVTGRDTLEYMVGASAGQHMTVTLGSPNRSIYFNVFAPGQEPGKDEALFIGDTGGSTFDGALPTSGNYMIQVYLYRNAARAGERANFTLAIAIDAAADATVPETRFNATGQINCARDTGQPLGSCKFGVIRGEGGKAELTVFWPDGGSRVIYFEQGAPVRYDGSQADGGAKLSFTKNADLFAITIGTQRFEFPEAAITGG